jgi:hypothetical protein
MPRYTDQRGLAVMQTEDTEAVRLPGGEPRATFRHSANPTASKPGQYVGDIDNVAPFGTSALPFKKQAKMISAHQTLMGYERHPANSVKAGTRFVNEFAILNAAPLGSVTRCRKPTQCSAAYDVAS